MKILHYGLGFPPYRTGGATKFCIDLMKWQAAQGHETALLWPGRMGLFSGAVAVKDRGLAEIDGETSGIRSFELCNPLPVPYDEGIRPCDISDYTKDAGEGAYERLFRQFCPDVIHIHTLMGLHGGFLEGARRRGTRCVFTAHDYFPICPKVTMFRDGQVCAAAGDFSQCGKCNETALSINRIKILQSPFYRRLKDFPAVRRLRRLHRDRFLSGEAAGKKARALGKAEDYRRLRGHYESLLKKMDAIHYNSALTKSVYEKYFELPQHSAVIGISHGDIKDCRKKRKFSPNEIRLCYLGPQGEAKGFFCCRRRLTDCGMSIPGFACMYILSL